MMSVRDLSQKCIMCVCVCVRDLEVSLTDMFYPKWGCSGINSFCVQPCFCSWSPCFELHLGGNKLEKSLPKKKCFRLGHAAIEEPWKMVCF